LLAALLSTDASAAQPRCQRGDLLQATRSVDALHVPDG
jgi:hypothetical protein